MKITLILIFFLAFILIPIFTSNVFAENLSPVKQWKKFADPDLLICKDGFILLQKNNGFPACVKPSTYLKLVDRGFTQIDFSLIHNRPNMMNSLMQNLTLEENLMIHWHDMMMKNPNVISETMDDWISSMKENPHLLENVMGPITSDPELREKMINVMKNHPTMENTLKQNSRWMDSVHHPMMSSGMGQGMHHQECEWCPEYQENEYRHNTFRHSEKMMDLMHHIWINEQMSFDMHEFMLENPKHMAQMANHMMEPMLGRMMDDPELRQMMIDLMLEHQEFIDSIRHDN